MFNIQNWMCHTDQKWSSLMLPLCHLLLTQPDQEYQYKSLCSKLTVTKEALY